MSRCVIVLAYGAESIDSGVLRPDDYIICADGGCDWARVRGITPNVAIGDFDSISGPLPDISEVVRLPVAKDFSDAWLCAEFAFSRGYRDMLMLGGIGGRLDHTLANVQLLCHMSDMGARAWMFDGLNHITVLRGGDTLRLRPDERGSSFSLLACSDECVGVTMTGARYPLEGACLRNNFPLGLSNEIADDEAVISFDRGRLAVLRCVH